MRTIAAAVAGIFVLLASCGAPEVNPIDDTEQADADLSGRLEGDRQLEGGCAWLREDDADQPFPGEVGHPQVEPIWPEGYTVEFDPLRLLDPDGEVVAREGDIVRVDGDTREDMMTICQVGPVFEVTRIVAVK